MRQRLHKRKAKDTAAYIRKEASTRLRIRERLYEALLIGTYALL